ncbi:hypothetical protein [Polyangium aurulentum]|uniref:hypothetical protein n=1 Tax=Polyangium aurulentum TaxID=2567896 RepID=UPI00146EF303|nr:hypothetical protein [Polyangium aurulentum]UQA63218.1 hypothetical protein E8A73_023245 [Polyangium aurulentum]
MQCLTDPLERVAEAMRVFIDRPALRLLHVTTADAIRIPVLEHVMAAEHDAENLCPFVCLEAPVEEGDDGWGIRAVELRVDMEALCEREATAPEGAAEVRSMPAEARAKTDLGRFLLELRVAVQCLGKPLAGLVVVLSPVWVRDVARWQEDVRALLAREDLGRVRWVLVDLEEPISLDVARGLGASAYLVDARIDVAALQEESDALAASIESAPSGAWGARATGAAGPDEAPPPRYNARALDPEELRALAEGANLPPEVLSVEPMQKLRALITGAARAARNRDVAGAVAKQREARAFCKGIGWRKGAVMMACLLGGYALQAGAPRAALDIFTEARDEATEEDMAELAAQAEMARGTCLLLEKRDDEAARSFAEAGMLAGELGSKVMAIEGYRMCGQILLGRGDEKHAVQAFVRALEYAEGATPQERATSSAAEAMHALASVCRAHRLGAQADALEAQAAAMERGQEKEGGRHVAGHAG